MISLKKISICIATAASLFLLPDTTKANVKREKVPGIIIPNERDAENVVSERDLYYDVKFLSDSICAGRRTGTKGNTEAAFWITRKMISYGLLPLNGYFPDGFTLPDGRTGHNIIGMIPGETDNYIIVGAHYDNFGTLNGKMFPGADSNASGVVCMLNIARMFRALKRLGKRLDTNIIFVAFDAKIPNMYGSRHLWNMLELGWLRNPVTGEQITTGKISAMVNIDQIGCSLSTLKSGRKDYLIMLSGNNHHFENSLRESNEKYGIGLELAYDYYGSKTFTDLFYNRVCDQQVFVTGKVKAVLFTSGITMNNNKPEDTVDTMDLKVLKKRIWLIFHWIDRISRVS